MIAVRAYSTSRNPGTIASTGRSHNIGEVGWSLRLESKGGVLAKIDVSLSGGDRQTGIVRTSTRANRGHFRVNRRSHEVGVRDTRRGLDGNVAPERGRT